jgi:hypothetical protein
MMPFFRDVVACVLAASPSHVARQSSSTTIGFWARRSSCGTPRFVVGIEVEMSTSEILPTIRQLSSSRLRSPIDRRSVGAAEKLFRREVRASFRSGSYFARPIGGLVKLEGRTVTSELLSPGRSRLVLLAAQPLAQQCHAARTRYSQYFESLLGS